MTDQAHERTAAHRKPGWVAGAKHAFALVFLRDWHPVLRDPLDIFRLSFPIGAVIFAIQVHITLPMSLAPILYIGFARLDVVPDPSERVKSTSELVGMSLITMCLGVTAASFYEIYEWVVDHWFGQLHSAPAAAQRR